LAGIVRGRRCGSGRMDGGEGWALGYGEEVSLSTGKKSGRG